MFQSIIEPCKGAAGQYQARVQVQTLQSYKSVKDLLLADHQYNFLSLLIEEGQVICVNNEKEIIIPQDVCAREFDSAKKLQSINLPPRIPHSLYEFYCEPSGTELRPDYNIKYGFKDDKGLDIRSFNMQGAWVKIIDQFYTLDTMLYKSIALMHQVNLNNTNNTKKLGFLKQLQEHLPAGVFQKYGRSMRSHIIVANKFTLDLVDTDNFKFAPCFIEEVVVANDELNTERDTKNEPPNNTQNQSFKPEDSTVSTETIEVLSKTQQKKFSDRFLKNTRVQETYVLEDTFVVPSTKASRLLQVVQETLQKSLPERRELFSNPKSFFAKTLGEEFDADDYDDVFVQTPLYKSQRISHIGEWQPKAHFFIPKDGGGTWFPQHTIGIPLKEGIIMVPPDDVEKLKNKMETALEKGQDYIQHENQNIKVNKENLESIQKAHNHIEEVVKKSGMDISPKSSAEENRQKIVAIIKDNLEGHIYKDKKDDRIPQDLFIPSALNTSALKNGQLYPHQVEGLQWLQKAWNMQMRGVLLADDMGLGKTLQVLAFLAWIKELETTGRIKDQKPVFIVAPKSLIPNWKKEHKKYCPGLGLLQDGFGPWISKGKKANCRDVVATLQEAGAVLTPYQSLAQNEDVFRQISWRVIVFDECQAIKNPSTFQTDMAKAMAAEFSIGVTGTPVENRLSELWCIIDAIRPGFLGLYKDFKKSYEVDQNDATLQRLSRKIKSHTPVPLMMRRMKSDHLKGLPNKTEYVKAEIMAPFQQKLYQKTLNEAAINQSLQDSKNKSSQLTTIQRLKSISLAPVSKEHYSKDDIENLSPDFDRAPSNDNSFINSSGRLIALFKILDQIKNRKEKVLIFVESRYLQQELLPIIKNRYKLPRLPFLINGTMSGTTRQAKVDEFQGLPPDFDVMLLSPRVGGVGLTLTKANNVIHLERWWNPAVEDQCSDRVYRIGQNKDVNVYIPMSVRSQEEKQRVQKNSPLDVQSRSTSQELPDLSKSDSDKDQQNERPLQSFDMILHTLLSRKRNLSQNVIAPTAFSTAEQKQVYEQATGQKSSAIKDDFYKKQEWLSLRYRVLNHYGNRCQKCGATRQSGAELHVDHIKPRSTHPHLELDFDNLQVLCRDCNFGKSNKYTDDYR